MKGSDERVRMCVRALLPLISPPLFYTPTLLLASVTNFSPSRRALTLAVPSITSYEDNAMTLQMPTATSRTAETPDVPTLTVHSFAAQIHCHKLRAMFSAKVLVVNVQYFETFTQRVDSAR